MNTRGSALLGVHPGVGYTWQCMCVVCAHCAWEKEGDCV